MNETLISTDFIRLDAFMKFESLVASGGEAKQLIAEGLVGVNGETCTMRGKKLYPGDQVDFQGETYRIVHEHS